MYVIFGKDVNVPGSKLAEPDSSSPAQHGLQIHKVIQAAHAAVKKAQEIAVLAVVGAGDLGDGLGAR